MVNNEIVVYDVAVPKDDEIIGSTRWLSPQNTVSAEDSKVAWMRKWNKQTCTKNNFTYLKLL